MLNPSKFNSATGGSASSGSTSSNPVREGGSTEGIAGLYEYVKPGSAGEKSVRSLTLNSDGSVVFKEIGETSLEEFEINGTGNWSLTENGTTVTIRFPQIKKENKLKRQVLVKGLGDTHVTVDDGMDIPVEQLRNAPGHGVHKWKRV